MMNGAQQFWPHLPTVSMWNSSSAPPDRRNPVSLTLDNAAEVLDHCVANTANGGFTRTSHHAGHISPGDLWRPEQEVGRTPSPNFGGTLTGSSSSIRSARPTATRPTRYSPTAVADPLPVPVNWSAPRWARPHRRRSGSSVGAAAVARRRTGHHPPAGPPPSTAPECRRTCRATKARPSPLPHSSPRSPACRPRAKRSKICVRSSTGTPGPLSSTSNRAIAVPFGDRHLDHATAVPCRVVQKVRHHSHQPTTICVDRRRLFLHDGAAPLVVSLTLATRTARSTDSIARSSTSWSAREISSRSSNIFWNRSTSPPSRSTACPAARRHGGSPVPQYFDRVDHGGQR